MCYTVGPYWSFISYMCLCLVAHSCPTLCDLLSCGLSGYSVHGIFPCKNTQRLPFPPPRDFLNPRIKPESPVSPALQADSLFTKPSGKPILYIVVCICQPQSSNLSLPCLPLSNHKFIFYICNSILSQKVFDTEYLSAE